MSLLKRLFGKQAAESVDAIGVEDVRGSRRDDGEVILNLWYETDGLIVSALRSKAYVASGTDEEKLIFLQERANTDFTDAELHPVPDAVKAEVKLVGESGNASLGEHCTLEMLEMMGGFMALFRDIVNATPSHGFRFDTSQALMCITGLVEGPDGELAVKIDNQTPL
jgi:hypothetical protein